jgi:hypothetical protein
LPKVDGSLDFLTALIPVLGDPLNVATAASPRRATPYVRRWQVFPPQHKVLPAFSRAGAVRFLDATAPIFPGWLSWISRGPTVVIPGV